MSKDELFHLALCSEYLYSAGLPMPGDKPSPEIAKAGEAYREREFGSLDEFERQVIAYAKETYQRLWPLFVAELGVTSADETT